MKPQYKVAIAAAALVLAFVAGRFSTPKHVETSEVVDDAARIQVQTYTRVEWRETLVTNQHVHRTEQVKPDGTVTRTEDINTKTKMKSAGSSETVARHDGSQEHHEAKSHSETVTRADWRLGALVGVNVHGPLIPVYGGHVERRILGPFSLGAWGLSSGQVGASLSAEW